MPTCPGAPLSPRERTLAVSTAAPSRSPLPRHRSASPVEAAESARPPSWHWVLVAFVGLLYAALTAAGATTTSIAMPHLTAEGQELSDHWGQIQPIRSDEYNVFTPLTLSMRATGGEPALSPFGEEASLAHRYPVGPFQSVAFWDTLLLRSAAWLPDAQIFAAHWWLPSLLVLLCMPTWFVLMGARRSLGWLAGALVVFAPTNFWWSLQPTEVLAYTLAGCTAMLAAAERFRRGQRAVPVILCVLGGISIAGLPSNYLIWALLLGGGVLLASSVRLIAAADRSAWGALLLTGVIAGGLGAGVMLEGLPGLESLTSTIYPGHRRASAAPVGIGILFGAPLLSALDGASPTAFNQSELSTGFNAALLVLPLAWLASARRVLTRERLAEVALSAWGLGWLAWCIVTIGNLGESIPIASSVPPMRAAQSIGVIGVIALCLALSHVRPGQGRLALLAGSGTALLTLQAGALLRQDALPEMDLTVLWGASLAAGIVVGLLLWAPQSWVGPALASTAAVAVVLTASPLQFGLGDYRGSQASQVLADARTASDGADGLWASDLSSFDSLMLANGITSISGFQRSGPDPEQWRRIDPDGAYEEAWNRGGGYSVWQWDEGGPTRVETNGYDLIVTSIDPCTLAAAVPELTSIVSTHPLSASACLQEEQSVRWNGADLTIYRVLR